MNVIKNRYIFLSVSAFIVIASWVCIFVFGLRPGIDLRGGTQWIFQLPEVQISEYDLGVLLSELSGSDVSVKKTDDGDFLAKLPDISEENHQRYLLGVVQKFGEVKEKSFSSIGPTIGSELREKSILAIFAVLFGISLYIAWAFRKVSRPIKSWKYGLVTLLTLFHDVSIPTGFLAVLGYTSGIEIDTNFIVALLVVMGFSVHDTIVVFDRIRENILVMRGKNFLLADVINRSIRETIMRSINTSLTLVFVLLTILFFGPSSLFYFMLTILIGTIVGTYSSIFIASSFLFIWNKEK